MTTRIKGKKILLGVTGSIAAYKAACLVRLLVKYGADVKVILTPCGKEFITELTLATLSRNPVHCDLFKTEKSTQKDYFVSHVNLSKWADYLLVAPATANTIASFANGLCSNLLQAVYLSAKCPVMIAPAMDEDMFRNPIVRQNIEKLRALGNIIIPPGEGDLASGLTGEGRMAEPETIFEYLDTLKKKTELQGKKCLVTAGPTYEYLDPVRYFGNPSSGKMGIAVAESLASHGARVTLVCGPSDVESHHSAISRINVTSSAEMNDHCLRLFPDSDITVMAAAVSDFTPASYSKSKIKKTGSDFNILMKPVPDILAAMGKIKKNKQVLVGFALETDNPMENAFQKLKNKNLDLIVLNSPGKNGTGFRTDTNKITIIDRHKKIKSLGLKLKAEAADELVKEICRLL